MLVGARPAGAWETRIDGPAFPSLGAGHWKAVAVLPSGDVVAAGTSFGWGYDDPCWLVAARFAREGGTVRWQSRLAECGDDHSFGDFGNEELLIDGAGDLIVGRRDSMARAMGVYKLDGESGALLWHRQPIAFNKHGPFIHHIALAPGGDVVASASETWTYYDSSRLAVVRLAGASGDELWRQRFAGDTAAATSELEDLVNAADAIAIDAAGDIVLAGKLYDAVYIWDDEQEYGYWTQRAQPTVLKLAAADGAELWRRDGFATPFKALALSGTGDPLVLGLRPGSLDVQRLDGASGASMWSAAYPVGETSELIGGALVIDGAERLTASALEWRAAPDGAAAAWRPQVVHADATTGAPFWSRELASDDGECSLPRWAGPAATVLALSPPPASAPVVAGGVCSDAGSGLFVARLARASGAIEWRHIGPASATRQTAYALAVSGDDLVVGGQQAGAGERYGPLVTLLDTASGSENWRDERGGHAAGELLTYPSSQRARLVAVAPGGRVVALGDEALLPTLESVALRELAPTDGFVLGAAFWGPAIASDATHHGMTGRALAALPGGDVLVLGVSDYYQGGATIERRDGAGEVRFRIERPWADGDALGLPDGDAIVWGYERQGPGATPPTRFQIERLAPDGTTRWLREFNDLRTGGSRPGRRWVDATGATVVLHATPADWTIDAATALALDANDGRLLWRREWATDDVSVDLLPDGTALLGSRPLWHGAELAAWTIEHQGRDGRALGPPLVLADLWARGRLATLADGGFVVAQQRLPAGPGQTGDTALRLAKIDPATMRVVWETVVAPSNAREIAPFGLVALPSGDVLLSALPAAWSTEPGGAPQHVLARFAGGNGEVRWSRSTAAMPTDLSDEDDTLVAVALDGEMWLDGLDVQTSDFVVAGFDGLTGSDRPLGLAAACRGALGRAHAAALDGRYTALARCRNAIGRGGLAIPAEECALEPHTAALLARANRDFVTFEQSCGASDSAGVGAADITGPTARRPLGSPYTSEPDALDGPLLPAGNGLGPDFRAAAEARVATAAADLLQAVYGEAQPTDFAARRCQRALSDAARDLVRVTAFGSRACIDGIHEGLALPVPPPACIERGPSRELVGRVGRRARLWLERSCSSATLAVLDACADTGGARTTGALIAPDGRGGCLVEAARAALALS